MFSFAKEQQPQETSTSSPQAGEIKPQERADPIDVQYDKLNEWLLSRRFIPDTYAQQLKKLHAVIRQGLKELKTTNPNASAEDEQKIKSLIDELQPREEEGDDGVDYPWSKRVLEALEEVDKNTTTWYGGASTRLKAWRTIVKQYEKENLGLAELATKMIRNVKYEIPAVDSSIVKSKKSIEELSRKAQDWKKTAQDFRRKYQQQCQQLQITGEDIETEIRKLPKQLIDQFKSITKSVTASRKNLREALDFYIQFNESMGNNATTTETCALLSLFMDKDTDFVSVLDAKIKRGEVSVTPEMLKEAEELNKSKQEKEANVTEVEEKPVEIDWGDLDLGGGSATAEMEIDGSGSAEIEIESGGEAKEIDFGDIESKEVEIDFGDSSVEPVATSISSSSTSISQIAEWMSEHILANDQLRYMVVSDVLELQAFYEQRIYEEEHASENTVLASTGSNSKQVKKSVKQLNELLKSINQVVDQFNSEKLKSLILIKTSSRYVDRLIKSLYQLVQVANKMDQQVRDAEAKQVDIKNQIEKTYKPDLDKLKSKTKELQKFIAAEVSAKLLQGKRPVNIFGQINAYTQ